MKGQFLLGNRLSHVACNIYADKSSIVLDWLLRVGIEKQSLSLREVAKESGVSLGLVQKVFKQLISYGLLHSEGVRTKKKFFLTQPEKLLISWLDQYSIIKKCKILNFRSGFEGKEAILKALLKSSLKDKVALALHSAAEAHGCKNTNLNTLELYLLDESIEIELEKLLLLEPQERGYEVLLIKPYYKSLLQQSKAAGDRLKASSPLLTFLDLFHFPLRGQEQAEFLAQRNPELKHIYKKK